MNDKPSTPAAGAQPAQVPTRRERLHARLHSHRFLALTTKVVVTVVGVVVLGAGVVMMVTPGPGIVAIALGLAILATEWDWAERWLHSARRKAHEARLRAEAMDPAVRRRRIWLSALGLVVVVAALVVYLLVQGWPAFAVTGWDLVEETGRRLPDLPGM